MEGATPDARQQPAQHPTKKIYEFRRVTDVSIDRAKIVIDDGAKRRRVQGLAKHWVDAWDWKLLVAALTRKPVRAARTASQA